jgi:hypothetical protein
MLLFVINLVVTQLSLSQAPQGYDLQQNISNAGGESNVFGANTIRPLKPRYEGIVGTPYLSEKPINGSVTLTDNKRYTGYFNFDWMDNLPMFYKKETSSYMIIDNKMVKQINLSPTYDSLITLDPLKNEEGKLFFGQLLGQLDSTKIYMIVEKTVRKADFSGAYSSGKKYDEILSSFSYFTFDTINESCKPFKPSKKNFVQLFPTHADKISKNSFLIKPSKPEMIGAFIKLVRN